MATRTAARPAPACRPSVGTRDDNTTGAERGGGVDMTTATTTGQVYLERIDGQPAKVLTSSLCDDQAEYEWLALLRPYVVGASSTQPTLSYVTFDDGRAAVLRRTGDLNNQDGVRVQALLGPAIHLTAQVALAAEHWPGWLDATPPDRRISAPQPPAPSIRLAGELRSRALRQADMLAQGLAWLLQAPDAPLGMVGAPEDDRIPLLWALHEIAAAHLPRRSWTFSTNGDPEVFAIPGMITFFDAPLDHDPVPDRITVDFGRDQGASPHNEKLANSLVYRFEYGVDPSDSNAAPMQAPAAPVVAGPVAQAQPSIEPLFTKAAPAPRSGPPPITARQAGDLVRPVAAARTAREFEFELRRLEEIADRLSDHAELRAALEEADWASLPIRRFVLADRQPETFDRIVRIAFGRGEPALSGPSARADARRLAELATSDELVRALVRASEGTELAAPLAQRWIRQSQAPEPDPEEGIGRLGRTLRWLRLPITVAGERRLRRWLF